MPRPGKSFMELTDSTHRRLLTVNVTPRQLGATSTRHPHPQPPPTAATRSRTRSRKNRRYHNRETRRPPNNLQIRLVDQHHRPADITEQPPAETDEPGHVQRLAAHGKPHHPQHSHHRNQTRRHKPTNRAPTTTGVCPTGTHVVPAWSPNRIPTSSAKKACTPASAAPARIRRKPSAFHRATAFGPCPRAHHTGRYTDQPIRHSIAPTADTLNNTPKSCQINCATRMALWVGLPAWWVSVLSVEVAPLRLPDADIRPQDGLRSDSGRWWVSRTVSGVSRFRGDRFRGETV